MIYGTGIDIVQTERIREAVDRWGERFLARIFTQDEISYAYKKKDPFLPLSVRFAAKEAFIKALSHDQNIPLIDIEVRNQGNRTAREDRRVCETEGDSGNSSEPQP
jgi:holo-[acyl-carrier protein] synthase